MADFHPNKGVYTTTKVACEWEGVVIKKANQTFGKSGCACPCDSSYLS